MEIDNRFKFRFWDKKENKMIYPDKNLIYKTETKELNLSDMFSYKRFVPMQSTGLKDRYNNLIYQGDIVNVPLFDNSWTRMVCVWDRKEWVLAMLPSDMRYRKSTCKYCLSLHNECRMCDGYFLNDGHTTYKEFSSSVINGNIYENQHLLNIKQQLSKKVNL